MQTLRRGNIQLPVETTYDVDFVLEIARIEQAIDVPSTAVLIDVYRSASPTLFAETMLRDLPTARTVSSVLSLTPGVATTPPLYGTTGEVAFGGTQGSNGFTVDGVSLTESSVGNQWSDVDYNWLQQVQVIGLGASAEHGGFTGAVANGVLRSGSNRLSGLGEWLVTRPNWSGSNLADYPSGQNRPVPPRTILDWWDVNGQAGGPVVRDRVWVFGGAKTLHHAFREFDYAGPGRTTQRTSRALVKLDAAPGRSMRCRASSRPTTTM